MADDNLINKRKLEDDAPNDGDSKKAKTEESSEVQSSVFEASTSANSSNLTDGDEADASEDDYADFDQYYDDVEVPPKETYTSEEDVGNLSSQYLSKGRKSEEIGSGGSFSLTDFPTCVLLELLKFLDATSLYQLSRTCELFSNLVLDRSLWRKIDGRMYPNKRRKVKYLQKRINSRTRDIRFAGANQAHQISKYRFFNNSTLNLTVLAIENQYLNAHQLTLSVFPKTLEELSLKSTYVQHAKGIFMKNAASVLTRLRVLILDDCQWLTSEIFMCVSKLPALEILSLYKCKQRTSADLCYMSLAGSIGFPKLKIMNCRFTALSDEALKVMYKNPNLQELYFQCYERTYTLEKAQRELDILTGKSVVEPFAYLNQEYFINDTNSRFMHKYFGRGNLSSKSTNALNDCATHHFNNCISKPKEQSPQESALYTPQYGPCVCNFQEKFWNRNDEEIPEEAQQQPSSRVMYEPITDFQHKLCRPPCYYFKYVNVPSKAAEIKNVITWLERKVRRDLYRLHRGHSRRIYMVRPEIERINSDTLLDKKMKALVNTPATRENKKRHFLFVREPSNLYEIEMMNHAAGDYAIIDLSLFRWTSEDHDYHRNRNIIRVNNQVNIFRPSFIRHFNSADISQQGQGSCPNSKCLPIRKRKAARRRCRTRIGNYPYYKAGGENDDSYTDLSSSSDEASDGQNPNAPKFQPGDYMPKSAIFDGTETDDTDMDEEGTKATGRFNKIKGRGRIRRLSYSDSSCPSGNEDDEYNPNVREETRNALRKIREQSEKFKKNTGRYNRKSNPKNTLHKVNFFSGGVSSDSEQESNGWDRVKPYIISKMKDGSRTYSTDSSETSEEYPPPGPSNNPNPEELRMPPNVVLRNRVLRDGVSPYLKLRVPHCSPSFRDQIIYINIHHDDNLGVRLGLPQEQKKQKIQLRVLMLRGFSNITDNTLRYIDNIELDILDVTYTGVTAEGVRNYIINHPHTRVVHETACTCRPRLEF